MYSHQLSVSGRAGKTVNLLNKKAHVRVIDCPSAPGALYQTNEDIALELKNWCIKSLYIMLKYVEVRFVKSSMT